mmetsp:Transcript_40195/g.89187  ORF Transcript_40195/g.89187 Transcript_40195/m.89187 type:complete len:299 (+) Transcript_40195:535-1431(+)
MHTALISTALQSGMPASHQPTTHGSHFTFQYLTRSHFTTGRDHISLPSQIRHGSLALHVDCGPPITTSFRDAQRPQELLDRHRPALVLVHTPLEADGLVPRELEARRAECRLQLLTAQHAAAVLVHLYEGSAHRVLAARHLRPQALEQDLVVRHDEDVLVVLHVRVRVLVSLHQLKRAVVNLNLAAHVQVHVRVNVLALWLVHLLPLQELPPRDAAVPDGRLKDLHRVVHHEIRHDKAARQVNRAVLVRVSLHHAHREAQNDLVLVHQLVHVPLGGLGHQGHAVLEGVLQGAVPVVGR